MVVPLFIALGLRRPRLRQVVPPIFLISEQGGWAKCAWSGRRCSPDYVFDDIFIVDVVGFHDLSVHLSKFGSA